MISRDNSFFSTALKDVIKCILRQLANTGNWESMMALFLANHRLYTLFNNQLYLSDISLFENTRPRWLDANIEVKLNQLDKVLMSNYLASQVPLQLDNILAEQGIIPPDEANNVKAKIEFVKAAKAQAEMRVSELTNLEYLISMYLKLILIACLLLVVDKRSALTSIIYASLLFLPQLMTDAEKAKSEQLVADRFNAVLSNINKYRGKFLDNGRIDMSKISNLNISLFRKNQLRKEQDWKKNEYDKNWKGSSCTIL